MKFIRYTLECSFNIHGLLLPAKCKKITDLKSMMLLLTGAEKFKLLEMKDNFRLLHNLIYLDPKSLLS